MRNSLLTLTLSLNSIFTATIPSSPAGIPVSVCALPPVQSIPEPYLITNHSINDLDGKEHHYRSPDPVTDEIAEEFSVVFFSGGFVRKEEGLSPRLATNFDLTSLQPRDNWVYEYMYGCAEAAVVQIGLRGNQIAAFANSTADDLRATGHAKAKQIALGQI